MAAKTWYGTNTVLSTLSQEMSETSPGADATSSPQMGWVVGTGSTNSAHMDAGSSVAAATFASTTPPDGSLVTGTGSNGDHFRTTNTYTGTFANANWEWHGVVIGVTQAGAADGRTGVRLFRGPNADGTGATEITAAEQAGSTLTNISTTQQDSTVTFNPGSFSVTNEYIFLQVAWRRTGAGGMSTTDVAFRYGNTGTRLISANLVQSYSLACDAGSVAATGTDASLERGLRLNADAGSLALTGTDASPEKGYEIAADAGSVVITGTDATLTYTPNGGYTLTADAGSVDLTGTTASLEVGREVAADAGSVAVSGTDASLEFGRRLSADAGSYAITGTDATLTYGQPGAYELTAELGSVAVTGITASLEIDRAAAASAGSYALTGTDATLRAVRTLTCSAGSFAITGTDATLTYGSLQGYTLTCDAGSVAIAGADAQLTFADAPTPTPRRHAASWPSPRRVSSGRSVTRIRRTRG